MSKSLLDCAFRHIKSLILFFLIKLIKPLDLILIGSKKKVFDHIIKLLKYTWILRILYLNITTWNFHNCNFFPLSFCYFSTHLTNHQYLHLNFCGSTRICIVFIDNHVIAVFYCEFHNSQLVPLSGINGFHVFLNVKFWL